MFTSSIFYRDDFWKPISNTNNKPHEHGGGGDSTAHHSMFELFLIALSRLPAGGGRAGVQLVREVQAFPDQASWECEPPEALVEVN